VRAERTGNAWRHYQVVGLPGGGGNFGVFVGIGFVVFFVVSFVVVFAVVVVVVVVVVVTTVVAGAEDDDTRTELVDGAARHWLK
jgi:uncharacterized membrane protein